MTQTASSGPAFITPMLAAQAELVGLAGAFAPHDGLHDTAVTQLQLIRASAPAQPLPAMYEPGLVFVVQGRKQAVLGADTLVYDPLHYLLVSVTVLPQGQILEASARKPYLCIRLNLDPRELGSLLLQARPPETQTAGAPRGLRVARTSAPLADAMLRLLRLLETPDDVAVLAPLALREIYWRVLTGELGPQLRELAVAGSHAQRIARAVDLLKRRYAEPVRIEEVAEAVHMSPSTLHHHFKQATSMSPLQYQKHLRLHHARRLMLTTGLDAAAAGHEVGYESASQFSREYRRLFGAPPKAEIRQVRGALRAVG
ncbi:AraC family transcriptional regulator [Ramlibacter sp.]|uniref:AraC family transcriptional regulator n=1 Tax=Ramlibacter sp. TaxID=1917967 RepID=UPI0018370D1E|nr:AraC family transcriptional regulator [Ramlibacter sp.]MBA2676574.1 AraC family transcriptional regulator [Ramlibacter sp.]